MIGVTYEQLVRAHFGADFVPQGTEGLSNNPVNLTDDGLIVEGFVGVAPTKITVSTDSLTIVYEETVLSDREYNSLRWNDEFKFWGWW